MVVIFYWLKQWFHLIKAIYNMKSISINIKLRHYLITSFQETLYAAEGLTLTTEYRRKIQEKIPCLKTPHSTENITIMSCILNSHFTFCVTLFTHQKNITHVIRKTIITFYGHLQRMNSDQTIKNNLSYSQINSK